MFQHQGAEGRAKTLWSRLRSSACSNRARLTIVPHAVANLCALRSRDHSLQRFDRGGRSRVGEALPGASRPRALPVRTAPAPTIGSLTSRFTPWSVTAPTASTNESKPFAAKRVEQPSPPVAIRRSIASRRHRRASLKSCVRWPKGSRSLRLCGCLDTVKAQSPPGCHGLASTAPRCMTAGSATSHFRTSNSTNCARGSATGPRALAVGGA